MIDLDQNIGHQNCRRQMLQQNGWVESKIVVTLFGIHHEHVGQLMLGDKALEVDHVSFAHAWCAAAEHMEADDLPRLPLLPNGWER
jgi:hypothetical protein